MDTGVGGHSTAVGSGSGGGTVFLAAAAAERYKAPWGAGKGRYRWLRRLLCSDPGCYRGGGERRRTEMEWLMLLTEILITLGLNKGHVQFLSKALSDRRCWKQSKWGLCPETSRFALLWKLHKDRSK